MFGYYIMIKSGLLTFFIPLLYLLAVLIIWMTKGELGKQGVLRELGGLIPTFFGLCLWVCGFISLGTRAFAVLPKAKALQTTGIYRYFRHPLYLGITLTLLGLSLSLGSKEGLLYTIIIIIPINTLRARREEKVLVAKFGQKHLDYKKRTIF